MTIGVYDLLGRHRYYEFNIQNEQESPAVSYELELPKLMINIDDSSNKGSYLVFKDAPIVDDLIVDNGGSLSISVDKLYSISKIFLGLQFGICDYNGITGFGLTGKYQEQKERKRYSLLLGKYLSEISRFINRSKADMNIQNDCECSIILIPDWVDDENIDRIRNVASSCIKNPRVLWNSIAGCLSLNASLSKDFDDGDMISIRDDNTALPTNIRIKIHKENGRTIPGHYVFWDDDNPEKVIIRKDYYQTGSAFQYNSTFLYDCFDGEFNLIIEKSNSNPQSYVSYATPKAIQSMRVNAFPDVKGSISISKNDCSCARGAAIYYRMIKFGHTPYYEECKGLHLVTRKRFEEEIVLNPIVPYTEKLPAGKTEQQKEIEGISLQKGSDSVKFYVLFSLERDMNKLKNKHLRSFEQNLNVSDKLLNNPKEVPLLLQPTVDAGQGRARIQIRQSKSVNEEILKPVYLDWDHMSLTNPMMTVAILEENMERTFPVDIPAVVYDNRKFDKERISIELYVGGYSSYQIFNLAKSTFIDKNASGIEKLKRSSVLGSPKSNGYDIPPLRRNLVEKMFEKLLADYKTAQRQNDMSSAMGILRQIAWTYHGEYFKSVIDEVLQEIEISNSVRAQKITCCANLLYKDADMVRFMKSFIRRLSDPEKVSDWCRGAYQVLMYNSSFFKPVGGRDYLKADDLILCMNRLCNAYLFNSKHKTICENIDRTVYFLFKARKYYPTFCKPSSDSNNRRNDNLYRMLKYYVLSPKAAMAKALIDMKFELESETLTTDNASWKNYKEFALTKNRYLFNSDIFKRMIEQVAFPYSHDEWKVFNDWDLWTENKYYDALSKTRIGISKGTIGFEECFSFYQIRLERFYDNYCFFVGIKTEKRSTITWTTEIAKMLVGKGNLNIPLGDEDA